MKKISLVEILIFIFSIVLILLSIRPLFKRAFFPIHDYTHVVRLYELDKALKDGHFPARWSADLGWGFGMPLFNFYAPLPYYLAEFFHLLGFSFLNAIKICFGATFFIGFLGMYFFAKKFWSKWGALLAAIAFIYSPYRAVDFYARGAFGELFAISIIPWVFLGITDLINQLIYNQEDKSTKFPACLEAKRAGRQINKLICRLAILLAIFLLSHTILNLICFPFFVLYSIFYFLINKIHWKKLSTLLFGFLLGLGIAAFFLIPAFFEKQYTQVYKLTYNYSHYSHHFLYFRQFILGTWGYGASVDGIEDGMSFHLGRGHLLLAGITILFLIFQIIKKRKIGQKSLTSFFFLILIFISAFLSTYHAKPIWDAIPLMAFIQFPWRFNSFIIVLLAFLAGGSTLFIKQQFGQKAGIFFITIFIFLLVKVNLSYFRPEKYLDPATLYSTDEQKIKQEISGVIPDYLPRWAELENKDINAKEYQIIDANLSGETGVDLTPEIVILENKTNSLTIKAYLKADALMAINKNYFPGWQLKINSKPENFLVNKQGIINFNLKKGENLIEWQYKDTFAVRLGNVLSLLSCLIIIFLLLDKQIIHRYISNINNLLSDKKKQKKISTILILLIIINYFVFLFSNKSSYLLPYNHKKNSDFYAKSQYVTPNNPNVIYMGDNDLYAFAGLEYLHGINPINLNFEHPPLGKYIIGLSIKIFGNENCLMPVFGILTLLCLFFISKLTTKNVNLSLLITLLFCLNPLFQSQLKISMLDLIQLTAVIFCFWMYLLAQEKKGYYLALGLGIGFAISVKYCLPMIIFILLLIGDQLINSLKKIKNFIICLLVSLVVYFTSYIQYFLYGGTFFDFIKFQNWLFHWYLKRGIQGGQNTILSSTLLGVYYLEKAGTTKVFDMIIGYNEHWNIFWVISTLVFGVSFFSFIKEKLRPRQYFFIYFWPFTYFLSLIKGQTSERYLLIILPFVFLGVFIWIQKKVKYLLHP